MPGSLWPGPATGHQPFPTDVRGQWGSRAGQGGDISYQRLNPVLTTSTELGSVMRVVHESRWDGYVYTFRLWQGWGGGNEAGGLLGV